MIRVISQTWPNGSRTLPAWTPLAGWSDQRRAGGHRPLDRGIDILHLQIEGHRGPAERLGPDDVLELRVLVGEIDLGRADPERRMPDPPILLLDQELLARPERGGVEGDRRPRTTNRQVGSDRLDPERVAAVGAHPIRR